MAQDQQDDPVWDAAWAWVQRAYDRDSFDDHARAERDRWLLADPAHRRAYERASQVWALTGLVPARSDLGAWSEAELDNRLG
jgi:transmembrane sensor